MTTFEEACECPRCHRPMEVELVSEDRAIKRKVYATKCLTEGCSWFNTGRAIQTDNGTVFERSAGPRGMDKTFPTLTPGELAHGQRQVEDAVARDLRDSEGL